MLARIFERFTVAPRFEHVARLTRWDEHVLFTVPVTLLGTGTALYHHATPRAAPLRVLLVLVANVCAVAFAFMVNDLEDAPDDARDAVRRTRNVIARGELSRRAGWSWAMAVGALGLALYALLGRIVLELGAATLALGLLYSWRAVRLKAWPMVDVLAHVLMLSAFLFFGGYAALGGTLQKAGLLALSVALISAYGQFYNQLRDYQTDRLAGLHNTASLLGQQGTRGVMWGSLAGGIACLGAALLSGKFPAVWAIAVALAAPLVWLRRSRDDMRGTPAIDATGKLQNGAMALVTSVLASWLAWALWIR